MLRAVLLCPGEVGVIDPAARGAWRELEMKLRPFVLRRVRSEVDADDVLQDVFLRMQRGLADLRSDERFGPWVYQVARSAIADHHRVAAKHRVVDGDEPEEQPVDGDNDSADAALASCVAPFVRGLPSPYREALTLVELEGLTQKQAAEMLGISLSGMKSRVQRGRIRLRKTFEDCCTIALDARGGVAAYEPRQDGCLPKSCCAEAANLPEFIIERFGAGLVTSPA